ncbi:PMT family glycosyltransferase ArnT/Agl22 [Commensalibacter communis]|uniref:Involved in glycosylation of proteins and lipid IVA (ArnT) n=1 Tax=Commensalibacter communis TaxID=2972786 RepID=A0A9W4TNW2_9PROT|nr:glycosyltransferase family 39 protein [Commensalibacter communis]CAI3937510.1 PMT family glycosyltransferase ArnT/Agl22 [Commensalibacter communis]CAI3942807.1 PMT family glycosyltransferase ArnT/Agl22 [Commensalibacter communis]CAI3943853.1 PMT family glycosyltransferase ArnT/Agl22 [Commensalibacter communis]CAI3945916.1 PMT family glycosyltransferase ArnT/Agl22 [Commensalibacter communis]
MTLSSPVEKSFRLKASHYVWLALFVFVLFLPGRATLPPLDRDEARYMQATSQMIESHNYIDVRFQDKPRYLQPAGIYWLEAIAVKAAKATGMVKGKAAWAYRIPSLLAAVGSVLLTVWIGSILFDSYIGLLAGLFLAVSVLLTGEGRMATIDTNLLFAVLLAQSSLARAWMARLTTEKLSVSVAIIYWGAIGCGLMLKGPVMLIPTLLPPIILAWVKKDRSWWKHLHPKWGWILMLLIVIPWCAAIWVISDGKFFTDAVGTNLLSKVASGKESHGAPPGLYLGIFLITFWPGSLFTAWALPYIWRERKSESVCFLLCWIIPHWIVFELVKTKLPHYVLPTYPAIAILTSMALWNISKTWDGPTSRWGRWLLRIYMVLWVAVGLLLAVGGIIYAYYMTGTWFWAAMLGAAAALILIGYAVVCILKYNMQRASLVSIGAAIVIYLELFVILIPGLSSEWLSGKIAETVNLLKPCENSIVASASYSEPSLVFLVGKETKLINAEKTAQFLKDNQSCGLGLVDQRDEKKFMQSIDNEGLTVKEIGRIHGLNYSNGKQLSLGLFEVIQ